MTGWSYTINPVTALLTYAIPGVGAVVGQTLTAGQAIACASSVSVMHQSQNLHQKTHSPTMMIAEDYDINVGNAYLKDTQIRGKIGKVHAEGDLKMESSRDEYSNDVEGRSYSSSLGFMAAKNGAQAAVSLVKGTSRGVTDIHEKNNRVNNFSALTAEDSFELEVGGNLEATSAYYGQKKLDEPITEPRTSLNSNNPKEQIKIKGKAHHNVLEDEYGYKDGSYNASIGDLYQVVSTIVPNLEQEIMEAISDGALDKNEATDSLLGRIKAGDKKAQDLYVQIKQENNEIRKNIVDKLVEQGATSEEIERIVFNPAINDIIVASDKIRCQQAIQIFLHNESIEVQQERYDNRILLNSLGMFTDSAVAIDQFATENPRLTQFILTALDIATSGPSKFLLHYCSDKLGIQGKIDECKDTVHDWLTEKVETLTGLSPEVSKVLVSGGMFGIDFGLSVTGAQSKDKIISEAKNVAKLHKNSLKWRGDTHVYRILRNGKEYKIGESAQGLNRSGLSRRAEQQARKLRKETGDEFKTEVIANFPGKREARKFETESILERRAKDPSALPGNKGIH